MVAALFVLMCTATVTTAYHANGSYNSFLRQAGFCKAQSFDTVSKSTSRGPNMFLAGRVASGVGLSHAQFQRSVTSCGRCIQIHSVDRFYHFNDELTHWYYDRPHNGNFTVMVFDECTDAICTSGFLDFDIYHERQPVAHGNPTDISWHFVPCPVSSDDRIGFMVCMGHRSCNRNDLEGRAVRELYADALHHNWFSLFPRNSRTAILSVRVQGMPLLDNQSWLWGSQHSADLLRGHLWLLEWTNEDGTTQSWVLDWSVYLDMHTTPGYRGGVIIHTDLQN